MEGHSLLTAEYLGSIAGIVTLAILLTHLTKQHLGNVPGISRVPVFAFVAAWTAGLTWVAVNVVHSLEGDTASLIVQALLFALASVGTLEVKRAGFKAMEKSSTAQRAAIDADIDRRMWVLPLLLAGALTMSACAGRAAPGIPPASSPAKAADQMQAVRAQAARLAVATREASAIAVELRRLAERSYNAGAISAATMRRINAAAMVASDKGLAFIEFARTVTTEPSLRASASALLRVFDDFLATVSIDSDAMRVALAAFRAYLGGQ